MTTASMSRFPLKPITSPLARRTRSTYLLVSEVQLLRAWARDVRRMFHGAMPYHVGSSLRRADYRDVDVRTLLPDTEYDALAERLNLGMLHMSVSLWGQQVTDLPIDFQLQRQTEANAAYPSQTGHHRHALGIAADMLDQGQPWHLESYPR